MLCAPGRQPFTSQTLGQLQCILRWQGAGLAEKLVYALFAMTVFVQIVLRFVAPA